MKPQSSLWRRKWEKSTAMTSITFPVLISRSGNTKVFKIPSIGRSFICTIEDNREISRLLTTVCRVWYISKSLEEKEKFILTHRGYIIEGESLEATVLLDYMFEGWPRFFEIEIT